LKERLDSGSPFFVRLLYSENRVLAQGLVNG
jgi:hypothetical protein